ncbi:hypothetical protein K1W54_13335 [Micromonospora sp. CPCC 205371]|nr:hypothetical protein [Micromonospora sp. CPCC 205371]
MAIGRASGASDVECLDCGQPLRDPLSRALHRGPVCRRRLRIARAGVALPLLPRAAFVAAVPGQTALPLDAATDTVPEAVPADRPDPKAPHPYEADPADETRDWSGKPTAPCRWCLLPRQNTIHRRPRTPRKSPTDRRRELLAAAGRARDFAVLGERDDQEVNTDA